jgi:outer membrane biosynthesis protein TonB
MRDIISFFALLLLFTGSAAQAQTTPADSTPPAKPPSTDDNAKPQKSTGGVQILSDTQGVDFNPWLARWHSATDRTWRPLIPDEVNPPKLKTGQVLIRFEVLPDGNLKADSMILEGRSGDTALDRAAWGAIPGSNYPPLPKKFQRPFIELRALFLYNMVQK